jgi:hypothetical protein
MARQGRQGRQGQGRKRGPSNAKPRTSNSDYFTQPGKRGTVVVLRKPIGNRATAKICGIMPSRVHAQMLVNQLEKAESVVKDLFMEATDDGIEALEAVLAACCKEVLARGPKTRPEVSDAGAESAADSV